MAYWFCKMANGGGRVTEGYFLRLFFLILLAGGVFLWSLTLCKGRFLHQCGIMVPKLPIGVLFLIFLAFLLGMFKMEKEQSACLLEQKLIVERMAEEPAKKNKNAAAEGRLVSETEKNGVISLYLKDVTVNYDGEQYQIPAIMASFEPEIWAEKTKMIKGGTVPGMKIKAMGSLSLFSEARNPGEFDYRIYYRSRKLFCQMKGRSATIVDKRASPFSHCVKGVRGHVMNALSHLCEEKDRGIYQAVLLGDKTQISEELRALYQKSGIAHLLAVSGLHVSIIGMGIYQMLRRLGAGYRNAGVLSGAALFFYGTLTGFGPSVIRAFIMMLCCFLAAYLGRTYDLLSAIACSFILIIWDSPFLLFTSGLQLSFGAVFSIGFGIEQLEKWKQEEKQLFLKENKEDKRRGEKQKKGKIKKGKRKEKFAEEKDGIWISLFIQLLTLPIILYHFYEYPVYSILLNFLTLPLMAYVVGSGLLAICFYTFVPALKISAVAAVGAIGSGHYILAFYEGLCRRISKLPFSLLICGRPELWKIGIYYIALIFPLYYKYGGVRKRKNRFLLISIAGFMFLTLRPLPGLEITVLDVGQGDGIVIETSQVKILVDGGSSQIKNLGKSRLTPFLKSRGISSLDFVLVSHGDKDHISGIEYLLEEDNGINIGCLVFSCLSRDDETCSRLKELQLKKGGNVAFMKSGQRLQNGKLKLTSIFPSEDSYAKDKNGQSLVLLLEYGTFRMLLTGDMEEEGEKQILEEGTLENPVTILKAGHHGSKTSSSQAFLELIRPEAAVLSYGEGNSYGHPSEEVVKRMADMGTEIWKTGEMGAVQIWTDGKRTEIRGFLINPGAGTSPVKRVKTYKKKSAIILSKIDCKFRSGEDKENEGCRL